MNLDDLQKQAEIDTKIDETQLSNFTLSLPSITTKWLRYLSDTRIIYEALQIELAVEQRKRGKYYRFDSDYKIKDKTHYDELMKGDKALNKVKARLVITLESINFIEGVIKNLNSASFNIKNHIEWKKFQQGGY